MGPKTWKREFQLQWLQIWAALLNSNHKIIIFCDLYFLLLPVDHSSKIEIKIFHLFLSNGASRNEKNC